jgi:hypothetical protein
LFFIVFIVYDSLFFIVFIVWSHCFSLFSLFFDSLLNLGLTCRRNSLLFIVSILWNHCFHCFIVFDPLLNLGLTRCRLQNVSVFLCFHCLDSMLFIVSLCSGLSEVPGFKCLSMCTFARARARSELLGADAFQKKRSAHAEELLGRMRISKKSLG